MTKYGIALADWQRVKEEIRNILIDLAKAKQTISYGELSRMLQTARIHPHAYAFAGLLREICNEEDDAGRGLLCALVVRQSTGIPGMGFFRHAARRGRDIENAVACWEDELSYLYQIWQD